MSEFLRKLGWLGRRRRKEVELQEDSSSIWPKRPKNADRQG